MRIGIPKERTENETRVSLVPVSIPKLAKLGFDVVIEKNAGEKSGYSDSEYEEKGAKTGALEEIMKSEIEAYSHQNNLSIGFALINEFCVHSPACQ